MKRVPIVGDVVCLGYSSIERLVVEVEDYRATDRTVVFTCVDFNLIGVMPTQNHTPYQVSSIDTNIIGPEVVALEKISLVHNVKFKTKADGYVFVKINR